VVSELTLGYSPCPNDTFMFNAIAQGTTGIDGYRLKPVLHDVETLNGLAMDAVLDISKVSFYAWLKVKENYRLLSSGAAMGFGCGPMLIARRSLTKADIPHCRVVLPGRWTTANLLFQLWAPDAQTVSFTTYDRIFDALAAGQADCGVIIHESRFTFESAGFKPVMDLGAWWEETTALPIPLGGIVAKKRLGGPLIDEIDDAIQTSIEQARSSPEKTLSYVRQHAQELEETVLTAHIRTFVNDFSLTMTPKGARAIETLESMAREAGVL
jgi:1,4-dihydroxy-6-naphthoate synthase